MVALRHHGGGFMCTLGVIFGMIKRKSLLILILGALIWEINDGLLNINLSLQFVMLKCLSIGTYL